VILLKDNIEVVVRATGTLRVVALDGVVTSLRETASQRGNDYTTFELKDASGLRAVTIFTWGHPA
jgi:hypothetical protein